MKFVLGSCAEYLIFVCKQKPEYEMRISDWSSYVCSSDLFQGFNCVGSINQVFQVTMKHPGFFYRFQHSFCFGGMPSEWFGTKDGFASSSGFKHCCFVQVIWE